MNVSSSGRHATKESPEVGAKGGSSSGPISKPALPRRGSDPALPVSVNKASTPTKISHSGDSGGPNPVSDECKSPSVKLRSDHSPGSTSARSGGISSNTTAVKGATKKPSCKSRHHQHHHHSHGVVPSGVTARAVLAPSCPSAIENSLAGRSSMHHGKRDDSLSAASAISSTLDVGGALVDPGSSGRAGSGSDCGKEFLQHRDSAAGNCGTYPTSAPPSTITSSHHHHHHHHHHHSSGASRRTKNRSKRKKTSKISSASSGAHSGTFSSDNPVLTGETSDPLGQKSESNIRGCDEFKPLEGTATAKQHPKPHHQHSTSSLLSSSVRVPSALLSGAAQSMDGGSITAVATTQGRKGSANTVSIPSAAAAMAAGMVPPSLAQPSAKIIEQSQISHTSHTGPTNKDVSHAGTHSSGTHHHHRHHHHSHVHSHAVEDHKSTVVSESISISTVSSTMHYPGTSSKCTQTKLEDEEDTLIPTSPTLARQSPMLVGGVTGTEETYSTSFSKMNMEESSGNITMRSSHHSHTKSTTSTKHQGTSVPSQGHFISKTESKLSSEQDKSKVPANLPNQKVSHQTCRTEGSNIPAHSEAVKDTPKNNKAHSLDELGQERLSTQHLHEHQESSRGCKLKSGDGGPGPPTDQSDNTNLNQDNQQTSGDNPKPIGKEVLQEEGACSVPKPGDKTTADKSNDPKDSGGAESSTTQTWTSSTDVCPWEDE